MIRQRLCLTQLGALQHSKQQMCKRSQCATIPVAFGVRGWLLTGPLGGAPLASPADDLLGFMPARLALDPGTRWLTPSPWESLHPSRPVSSHSPVGILALIDVAHDVCMAPAIV